MIRYFLIGLLFFGQSILIQSVQAQMYQWVDPESGTTQLSGKPPTWYRSIEGGPRVFVFNRGKVVDDTGIDISDEQRTALRTKAFVRAEEDRIAAKEKAMEAAKLKAAMARNADETVLQDSEDTVLSEESLDEQVMAGSIEDEVSEEEVSVEKMKALIEEWENKRTEEAKALLQQGVNDT